MTRTAETPCVRETGRPHEARVERAPDAPAPESPYEHPAGTKGAVVSSVHRGVQRGARRIARIKMLRRFCFATARTLYRWRSAIRMRWLHGSPRPPRQSLFPPPNATATPWTYQDERWNRVVHRGEHRRLLKRQRPLVVEPDPQSPRDDVQLAPDGSIIADVAAEGAERWVYLFLDPQTCRWRDYRWSFTARRDASFRELQFGFRYVDFYNRYRFRHEDDRLHFDIVHNGAFDNSVLSAPFAMDLGRDYRFVIDVADRRFILAVDGRVVLDVYDVWRRFAEGPIATILWEDDGRTPIRAAITEMQVEEI